MIETVATVIAAERMMLKMMREKTRTEPFLGRRDIEDVGYCLVLVYAVLRRWTRCGRDFFCAN